MTFGESTIREFLGWLSGDIPELRKVEVPRLADSWERFKAQKKPVTPWGNWQQRAELARLVERGDRWIQIKSGRVAVVLGPLDEHGCIPLQHENGNKTNKWRSYFGQEFTPERPPVDSTARHP